METSYAWIEEYLKDENNQVVRVEGVSATPAVGQNENFLGSLTRLRVSVQLRSGETATKCYVLKQKPLDTTTAALCDQTGVFTTEIKVYTEFLKAVSRKLDEEGISYLLWPECIGVYGESILLQDLKEEGYAVLPKDQGHELAESESVLEALGRLHAASRAVVQDGFRPALGPPLYCQNCTYMVNFYRKPLHELSAVIRLYWPPEWSHVSDRVLEAAEDVGPRLANLWESTRGEFDVVNHGDCWSNNIMFRHGSEDSDIHLRFVDFQSCHYNSPCWDLCYYLENAVRPEARRAHEDRLLRTYLDSLRAASQRLRAHSRLSEQELRAGLRRVGYFAFLNGVVCAPLTVSADEPGFAYDYPELYAYVQPSPQELDRRATTSFYNYPKAKDITMKNLTRFLSENII